MNEYSEDRMQNNFEISEGKPIIKNQFAGRRLAIFTSGGDAPGKIS